MSLSALLARAALRRSPVASNLGARLGALGSLAVATLVVARTSGPAGVGLLALLRVLPWLMGVLMSCGLFASAPYFLAGPTRSDRRLPATIVAIALLGGSLGGVVWALLANLIGYAFFKDIPPVLVLWAGATVLTQLLESTAKACSQGTGDLPGANRIIFLEEFMFLPAYLALWGLGIRGNVGIVAGLLLSDAATNLLGWKRLVGRGFFAGARRPSGTLAREICWFGIRGQIGSIFLLLNQRLDFLLVGALVGSAPLGIYAIASRFAELLRLPSLAIGYVMYPEYAREGRAVAADKARSLIPRSGLLTAGAALPLAAAASLLPWVYGEEFRAGIIPTYILLVGLSGGGVVGVISAFLYGVGRPGLNSLAMGAGLAVTVILDLLLIPRFGITGAAIASSTAYLTTMFVLAGCFWSLGRSSSSRWRGPSRAGSEQTDRLSGVDVGIAPGVARRVLDVLVAGLALVMLAPVLLTIGLLVWITSPGPPIFRQVRVGQGGTLFMLYKFRSMRPNAAGPLVTAPDDPRITRVGAFLRATSLDELPQLLNVLRGDMTLVGPRPEAPSLAERYPADCRQVFRYRPGLTGPVQVLLRDTDVIPSEIENAEGYYLRARVPVRVALDRDYLADPSLRRTLGWLGKTIGHVFRRARGADGLLDRSGAREVGGTSMRPWAEDNGWLGHGGK